MDLQTLAASRQDALYAPDGLFAHNAKSVRANGITLAAGQNLQRGTVLGLITASEKFAVAIATAVDGSQIPTAVLAEDTNASGSDVHTIAYFRGTFAEQRLILGAGLAIGPVRAALRMVGIYTDGAPPPAISAMVGRLWMDALAITLDGQAISFN